ncbi:MAG: hypothetical protein JNJ61_25645 [Anaerolineae bacterium]|nr:hypothetical protein [Anaerolineae bacterium]
MMPKPVPDGETILAQDDLGVAYSPHKDDARVQGRLIVRYETNVAGGDFLISAPNAGLFAGHRQGDGGVRATVLWADKIVYTGRYQDREMAESCALIAGLLEKYVIVSTIRPGRVRSKLYGRAVAA